MSSTALQPAARAPRSIDDLDAAICRLARQLNAESYRLLILVREFDDRMGWAKWSFLSCAEWLAWRCGLSLSAAREKVRTAQVLRALPAISEAFADGRLSYSKVRALTRAAQAHDEDLLLAYALQATAAQVEERCRQIRNSGPESAAAAQRAWERRSLTVWRSPAAHSATIKVELPLEEAELVKRALERAVEVGEVASGAEFGELSWRAQQVDALVAISKAYLAGGAAGPATGSTSADHCQVVVHADESSLRGGVGRSDLPIDTVKRLACDASLVTVVEDDRGRPLEVGRKQRTVSTALRRALWSRDRGCSFPGCHHTRFLDAHHIRHWAEGGDTSLENLMLLCSHHHRLLHEGGFRVRRDHQGELYFQRADGRVIPRFGYQAADSVDDDIGDPSAQRCPTAIAHARGPAEVRETLGAYWSGERLAVPTTGQPW
jgi:hypothetical protein